MCWYTAKLKHQPGNPIPLYILPIFHCMNSFITANLNGIYQLISMSSQRRLQHTFSSNSAELFCHVILSDFKNPITYFFIFNRISFSRLKNCWYSLLSLWPMMLYVNMYFTLFLFFFLLVIRPWKHTNKSALISASNFNPLGNWCMRSKNKLYLGSK